VEVQGTGEVKMLNPWSWYAGEWKGWS